MLTQEAASVRMYVMHSICTVRDRLCWALYIRRLQCNNCDFAEWVVRVVRHHFGMSGEMAYKMAAPTTFIHWNAVWQEFRIETLVLSIGWTV